MEIDLGEVSEEDEWVDTEDEDSTTESDGTPEKESTTENVVRKKCRTKMTKRAPIILDPKNVTKLQVRRDLDDYQAQMFGEEAAVQGRSSLEDFVLPTKKPREPRKFHGVKRESKSAESWVEECANMQRYLQNDEFPFEALTNRHFKRNFLRRQRKHFRLIDGQLRYFHKRPNASKGTFSS